MKKKYITISILIFIALATIISTLFLIKYKNRSQMIEATILLVADEYLLVTSNNQDYIVYTNELNYNINDVIAIELTDITSDKTPYEGKANKIILIKKEQIQESSKEPENIEQENINDYDTNYEQSNEQSQENYQEETVDTNTFQEENIINYFKSLENEVDTSSDEDETIGQKIKNKFVVCIDFIFYDKEINGVKFKDLTNKTKLKIIEITLSIDSKIDNKFPGYKEDVNNSYNNIKSKLIEKYLNITTDICNKDKNLCEEAKQGFNNIKKGFNITWDFIKNIIGNSTSKLKDWYEIWRYQ